MIDPPDVMIGEYIPFWWKYDNADDIVQVSSCNSINNGHKDKTYVLNTKDEYGQFCEFYLKNGAETGKKFIKYCNVKQDFNTSHLTKTYLE